MTAYWFAFFWGICILLAFLGWGRLINRIVFPGHRVDWGHATAWGLAFSIVIGGFLNATSHISRAALFILLSLGLLCWLVDMALFRPTPKTWLSRVKAKVRNAPMFMGLALLVCLLATIQYAASVITWFGPGPSFSYTFNVHDDFHAYLVFPE